jgi:hypothetical protein
MMKRDLQVNGSSLENSFGHGALSNKSYERIFPETIEAQNLSAHGGIGNYANNQYYNMGGGTSKNQGNPYNMTLQLSSKRAAGSANVSQYRLNA